MTISALFVQQHRKTSVLGLRRLRVTRMREEMKIRRGEGKKRLDDPTFFIYCPVSKSESQCILNKAWFEWAHFQKSRYINYVLKKILFDVLTICPSMI